MLSTQSASVPRLASIIGRSVRRVRLRGIPRLLYTTAPLLLGRGQQTLASTSGVRLVIDTRDYPSCMMFYGRYSPEIISLLRHVVSEGDSVFDIGAQIGYLTAHLARIVGPLGKVYSFEPDPNALVHLRQSVDANGSRHVSIFPVAVGDEGGTLTFNVSPTVGWSTAVKGTHHQDLQSIEVTAVRVDDMASSGEFRRPVRFVKLDVEGFECCVLDGMKELMRTDSPLVLAEVNPVMLGPNGHSVPDLLHRLSQNGRRLYVVSERQGLFNGGQVQLTRVPPTSDLPFCDVLAVPEGYRIPPSIPVTNE